MRSKGGVVPGLIWDDKSSGERRNEGMVDVKLKTWDDAAAEGSQSPRVPAARSPVLTFFFTVGSQSAGGNGQSIVCVV